MSNVTGRDTVQLLAETPPTVLDDRLAKVTAPIAWKYLPVTNISTLSALPPAAQERETKNAANTFASTGRNLFVYYVTRILTNRRSLLLESGTTKKKYPKTAAQLWQTVETEEAFYWNEAAKQLRLYMKEGMLSPKGCLIHGGEAEREGSLC